MGFALETISEAKSVLAEAEVVSHVLDLGQTLIRYFSIFLLHIRLSAYGLILTTSSEY
jgi:hypothetical protein